MPSIRRLSIAAASVLAFGLAASAAGAEDDTLMLEQPAVESKTLGSQTVGTAPEDDTRRAELATMPDAGSGGGTLDQPTYASSGAAIGGGAISASSLSATIGGGSVSLGN